MLFYNSYKPQLFTLSDSFHPGKENELILGLGESISILHFIMPGIFLMQKLSASCLTLQY